MRVLAIPEDPTYDPYIIRPVLEHVFLELGRSARVDVLRDPHLRGIDEALNAACVTQIIEDNGMMDLFVLVVDRDCNRKRNDSRVEARVREHGKLVGCVAVEEVEVWMLALHKKKLGARWSEVRGHCDPKETFADPLLARNRWSSSVGRGRKRAMRDIGKKWPGIVTLCPEIAELREQIRTWIAENLP